MTDVQVRHLFCAIKVGSVDSVVELLEEGVSPNSTIKYIVPEFSFASNREHEMNALSYAIELGYIRIVEALLDRGADINVRGTYGATPLAGAAGYGRLDIARLLIARGANIHATTTGNYAVNALFAALANGHEDVAEALVEAGLVEEPGLREWVGAKPRPQK